MDRSELAKMMLAWEDAQDRADDLADAVKAAVLELGETVITGNVTARFASGRKTYDYAGAVKAVLAEKPDALDLRAYEKVAVSYDYRTAALDGLGIGLENVPFTEGEPSVSLSVKR